MTEEELKEQVYSMSNEDFAQKIAAMNTVSDSSLDNSVSTQSVEPEPKTDDNNVDDTTQNNSNESNVDDNDRVIDDNNPFGENKAEHRTVTSVVDLTRCRSISVVRQMIQN